MFTVKLILKENYLILAFINSSCHFNVVVFAVIIDGQFIFSRINNINFFYLNQINLYCIKKIYILAVGFDYETIKQKKAYCYIIDLLKIDFSNCDFEDLILLFCFIFILKTSNSKY
jgi:hypothetical protein